MTSVICPCGSGLGYANCCQPYHQGQSAPTPESLMRSRYSAFVLSAPSYLLQTWHTSSRPSELSLDNSPQWKSLQVLASSQLNDTGKVHFRALYQAANNWFFLEESSDFVREQGRWYYLQGKTQEGQLKLGRNDKCPCGSGKKVKVCCN